MKLSSKTIDPGMLLALAAVLYSLVPVHNGNFFWHLRNGLDIIETGEIRTEDPFTWTRQGAYWIQQEWLAESAMALSWVHIGEGGPVLLKALLIGLSVLFAFKASVRGGGDPAFAFLFSVLWLALAQPRWIARPHFFSIFFFSVYLYILSLRINKPLKLTLILLPLQILWVNTHAGFVMGVFLASIPAMDKLLRGEYRQVLRWSVPPFVLLLASGIHPNGYRTLEYLPAFLAQPLYKETIREWWSPFDPRFAPQRVLSRPALILIAATSVTIAVLGFFRDRLHRGKLAGLFILIASTVFASRNGELLAPAMLAWIPGMLSLKIPRRAIWLPAAFILAVPFFHGIPRDVGPSRSPGIGVDWRVYPVGLADLLEAHPDLTSRAVVFNTNEVSGYLQYRFQDRMPLFMDGRCLLFPESFYREYLALCYPVGEDHLASQYRLFRKYGFNLAIYTGWERGSSAYLVAALPLWFPIYIDDLTAVYATGELLSQSGTDSLAFSHFDPLDPSEFLSRPLYLMPAKALPELTRLRDHTGTDLLDPVISALLFRADPASPLSTPKDAGGMEYTLRCWESCGKGDLEAAMEFAVLSSDIELQRAVGILAGGGLAPGESMMGIQGGDMRAPGSARAVEITALWVTGQGGPALELASLHLDSLPGWGVAQCGLLYSLAGNGERALELADLALTLRRGPVVLERAARIYRLEGRLQEAAEYCRESLAMSPDFTGAGLLLADCMWDMGLTGEAGVRYESIVNSGFELPEYARLRLQLNRTLLDMN